MAGFLHNKICRKGRCVIFKKFIKAIAVSLVVVMVLEVIPVAAVNEIQDMLQEASIQETSMLSDIENSVDAETPEAVCEIVPMRQENVKYFLMSDDTYTAAQCGVPVHYKDENNHWQDIGNTLEYVDTEAYKGYKIKQMLLMRHTMDQG